MPLTSLTSILSNLIFAFTGRRVCLGETVAKKELFLLFTHLLHQFTFVLPDDAPPLPSIELGQVPPDFHARAVTR